MYSSNLFPDKNLLSSYYEFINFPFMWISVVYDLVDCNENISWNILPLSTWHKPRVYRTHIIGCAKVHS